MAATKTLTSIIDPSKTYVVDAEPKGEGGKKKVFFSPKRDFAVGIYKSNPDQVFMDRLQDLVGRYRRDLFEHEGGDVWKTRFCWPYDIIRTEKGKIGIVMPLYPPHFLFEKGILKGKEKKGNWFTKPLSRRGVDPTEVGDWRGMLLCALDLARTIRRMHAAGLCHSDLSYNNVLLSPTNGKVQVIDVDELVVPGKYPAGVLGTNWFIAPEVVIDHNIEPSQRTDLHALACLIYLYLLRRHPLQGRKVFDQDPDSDDRIQQGKGALFVEDSRNDSNRPEVEGYKPLDWSNVKRLPYQAVTGPYLSKLIKQAFEEGIYDPSKRPSASEWENALWTTYERLTPCSNPKCPEHFFVLNKAKTCPFCLQPLSHTIPIFDIHCKRKDEWVFIKRQVYGTHGKSMHKWHFFDNVFFNEKTPKADIATVGSVVAHKGGWYFLNSKLNDLVIVMNGKETPLSIGGSIKLEEEMEIRNDADHGVMLKVKFI